MELTLNDCWSFITFGKWIKLVENIKRVLGKENEEISIQYEQYGIVSAEVVFIMVFFLFNRYYFKKSEYN